MRLLQRFPKRYLGLILGPVAILLVAAGWVFFSYEQLRSGVEGDLTYSAEVVAAAINQTYFNSLSYDASDVGSPAYIRLRQQFMKMGRVMARQHIKGIYAMKLLPGDEVRFIVDSAPSEDPYHSEPGTVYEQVSQSVYDVFHDGKKRFTGPETDEYGTFYSVLVSVGPEDEGTTIAIGADVDARVFDGLLRERLRLPAIVVLSALLLYVVLFLLFSQRATLREAIREQERRALRNAQERELLLMSIGEGVVACDDVGNVIYANRFARQTVCAPDVECVGLHYRQHWAIVDANGAALPDEQQPLSTASAAKGRASAVSRRYLRRTDGSLMPVAVSVAAINEKSGKRMIVMSYRDMTKEAEMDRMKTDFVDMAVHQLRTPLTSLKWSIEMLSAEAKPRSKDGASALSTIVEVTGHLNDLVGALLNITRVESGRLIVEPTPTDLGALVLGVVKEVDARIKGKGIAVAVSAEPGLPKVDVDGRLVREVYKNFLTNALKYTPAGGHVDIRIWNEGDEIIASFKDDGVGIPQDQQQRLFDKFFRARNVVGLPEEGTGLGLYFARQIAEVSGGRIWFQSTEGVGSTFYFALPRSGSPAKQGEIRIS